MRNLAMPCRNQLTILLVASTVALAACASPNVDTNAKSFNETQYPADLHNCRGGTAIGVALDGLGGAIVGSAFGALEGAYHGALAGDAPEGAVIGAVLGSVVGVVAGAYGPFKKQGEK